MRSIGIRELRQSASVVLRQVEQGMVFEITDRGRPVALLSPLPDLDMLHRLRAAGEVTTPTANLDDLPAPLPVAIGQTLPSETLARLRDDER